jgi:hypothetical protein
VDGAKEVAEFCFVQALIEPQAAAHVEARRTRALERGALIARIQTAEIASRASSRPWMQQTFTNKLSRSAAIPRPGPSS